MIAVVEGARVHYINEDRVPHIDASKRGDGTLFVSFDVEHQYEFSAAEGRKLEVYLRSKKPHFGGTFIELTAGLEE